MIILSNKTPHRHHGLPETMICWLVYRTCFWNWFYFIILISWEGFNRVCLYLLSIYPMFSFTLGILNGLWNYNHYIISIIQSPCSKQLLLCNMSFLPLYHFRWSLIEFVHNIQSCIFYRGTSLLLVKALSRFQGWSLLLSNIVWIVKN